MASVDIKNTDYYKSGKMKYNSMLANNKCKALREIYKCKCNKGFVSQEHLDIHNNTITKHCKICTNEFCDSRKLYCSSKCYHSDPVTIQKRKVANCKGMPIKKKNIPLLEREWDLLGYGSKRKRIIIEQKHECNKCNLSHWLTHPLILEIDHIDGDNKNNERSNLEALCPNCHSLTPTWRGRNKSNIRGKYIIPDDIFIDALKHNKSIAEALRMLDLSVKGGNYKRAKNLIFLHNIEMVEINNSKNTRR